MSPGTVLPGAASAGATSAKASHRQQSVAKRRRGRPRIHWPVISARAGDHAAAYFFLSEQLGEPSRRREADGREHLDWYHGTPMHVNPGIRATVEDGKVTEIEMYRG